MDCQERLLLANKTKHMTDSCSIINNKSSVINGKKLIVLLLLAQIISRGHSQPPVFLVDPESISAIDGTTVEFTCTANNTDEVGYRVNDTSASQESVIMRGFNQLSAEDLGNMVTRRNLSVAVSSLYNNTEILCRAFGTDNNVNSNTAILTVQGPLSSVVGLSYSFINSSTVNITWSPPFTLPGTNIIGYNISVATRNDSTNVIEDTTSDNYSVLSLTDSSCDKIIVTVSGYNGLDGENSTITIFSSDFFVPISMNISSIQSLTIFVDLTDVCRIKFPSLLTVTLQDSTNRVVDTANISVPMNTTILTVSDEFSIIEDQNYTISLSYSVNDTNYEFTNATQFDTYGIQRVVFTDRSDNMVTCICYFAVYSTDTSCRVLLIQDDNSDIQFSGTFNRTSDTNIAEGNITGVTTGRYGLLAFDSSSNFTVIASFLRDIRIIGEPPSVMTTMATSITATSVSDTTTTQTSPSVSPSVMNVRKDPNVVHIATGVLVGVLVIAIFIIIIIVCLYFRLRSNKEQEANLVSHYSDSDSNTVQTTGVTVSADGTSMEFMDKSPPRYTEEVQLDETVRVQETQYCSIDDFEKKEIERSPTPDRTGTEKQQPVSSQLPSPQDPSEEPQYSSPQIPPEVPSYRPEGPESPDHTCIPSTSNIPQYSYATIASTIPHYNDLIVIKNKEERSLQDKRNIRSQYSLASPLTDPSATHQIPQYEDLGIKNEEERSLQPNGHIVNGLSVERSPSKNFEEIETNRPIEEPHYNTTVHSLIPVPHSTVQDTEPQYSSLKAELQYIPSLEPMEEPRYNTTVHHHPPTQQYSPKVSQYSPNEPQYDTIELPAPVIPSSTEEPQYNIAVHFSQSPRYTSPEVIPQYPSDEPRYNKTIHSWSPRHVTSPEANCSPQKPSYDSIVLPQILSPRCSPVVPAQYTPDEPRYSSPEIPPEVSPYRPEGPESPDHIPSTSNIPQYSYATIASTIPHYNDLIVIKKKEERSLQGKTVRSQYSLATPLTDPPATHQIPQYEDVKPLLTKEDKKINNGYADLVFNTDSHNPVPGRTRPQETVRYSQILSHLTLDTDHDTTTPTVSPPPATSVPLSPPVPPPTIPAPSPPPPAIPPRPSRNSQFNNVQNHERLRDSTTGDFLCVESVHS